MAILWEGMSCPLCDQPIDIEADDFIAFPCVGITNPRYEDLDDAAVHRTCLNTWRKRNHFIELFNEALANSPNPVQDRLIVSPKGEVLWKTES